MTDFSQFLRHIALENAVKYDGKTNAKALVGKVLGSHPEYKAKMPELMQQLEAVVESVNATPLADQKAELEILGATQQTRKSHDQSELKELDGAKAGNVIMRFAPSPSGPPHIGHAITGGLTSLYVKKYGGKFILRIEDTNSDNIEIDAYKWLYEDLQWVFGNISEVVIQSDRMHIYYDYANRLFESGHLYVCECSSEQFKKYVEAKTDCPCKNHSPVDQLKRFERMFDKESGNGYKEGEAVVRFKAGMSHPNPAMRDFPLIRINDSPHPRQGTKFRVWPLMNFSVFVDDVEMGMTHIIRAKEHLDNSKRQELMYAAIGKQAPRSYFTGRYNIEGLEISKSRTKELIAKGEYSGWEDPRLAFIKPLRRRGYQPGAFLNFTKAVGLSPVDKTITMQDFFALLDNYNKEFIDPVANRYALLHDPVEVKLKNIGQESQTVMLDLHPKARGSGGRPFTINGSVLIEKEDLDATKEGCFVRLMDFCNLKRVGDMLEYSSESYEDYKAAPSNNKTIIHWLPADQSQLTTVHIQMPDGSQLLASAEKHIDRVKVGDVVQFERFGFCRLDSIDEKSGIRKFWYGHR